jgi:hypothetical protein
MAKHTVAPGDCCSSLAKQHNFSSYLSIYNHADNVALKANRPNPNQLAEGDTIEIPAKDKKEVPAATGQSHKFVAVLPKTFLRLVLLDAGGLPMKVKTSDLEVGGVKIANLPNAKGQIEVTIDPAAKDGVLKVTWESPATSMPASAAPPPAASPPPYPQVIVPAAFEDKTPEYKVPTEATWALALGTMEPAKLVRGCLRRLANLGYNVPDVKVEDVKTAVVVKAYQRFHGLAAKGAESGKVADIEAEIEKRHDLAP